MFHLPGPRHPPHSTFLPVRVIIHRLLFHVLLYNIQYTLMYARFLEAIPIRAVPAKHVAVTATIYLRFTSCPRNSSPLQIHFAICMLNPWPCFVVCFYKACRNYNLMIFFVLSRPLPLFEVFVSSPTPNVLLCPKVFFSLYILSLSSALLKNWY